MIDSTTLGALASATVGNWIVDYCELFDLDVQESTEL